MKHIAKLEIPASIVVHGWTAFDELSQALEVGGGESVSPEKLQHSWTSFTLELYENTTLNFISEDDQIIYSTSVYECRMQRDEAPILDPNDKKEVAAREALHIKRSENISIEDVGVQGIEPSASLGKKIVLRVDCETIGKVEASIEYDDEFDPSEVVIYKTGNGDVWVKYKGITVPHEFCIRERRNSEKLTLLSKETAFKYTVQDCSDMRSLLSGRADDETLRRIFHTAINSTWADKVEMRTSKGFEKHVLRFIQEIRTKFGEKVDQYDYGLNRDDAFFLIDCSGFWGGGKRGALVNRVGIWTLNENGGSGFIPWKKFAEQGRVVLTGNSLRLCDGTTLDLRHCSFKECNKFFELLVHAIQ